MAEGKKRILVVEDSAPIRTALGQKLESGGFEVLVAENGEEGLKTALSEKPDLILLDLMMPKMDGLSVLDELRKDEWGKKANVLVLTNLDKAEHVEESRKRGVTDFLVKTDWSLEDVLKRVKSELS